MPGAPGEGMYWNLQALEPELLLTELRARGRVEAVARRHIARGKTWGRIINISKGAAAGSPDEVSYWASKHALESYSRSAAMELGRYGITVNLHRLGRFRPVGSRVNWNNGVASTPLGQIGHPDDVADVVVFLASEQARWLTGQLIYVGGGHRMGL